jgi:hypothetical protein
MPHQQQLSAAFLDGKAAYTLSLRYTATGELLHPAPPFQRKWSRLLRGLAGAR